MNLKKEYIFKFSGNGGAILDILKVKGNTYCIDTGMTYIPFYKIDSERIIMLDTGWKSGEIKGIVGIIEKNNFKVSAILNSHAHIIYI